MAVLTVPLALGAMGFSLIFCAGCRKDEPPAEVRSTSPSVYMKDPVFRQALSNNHEVAKGIGKARAKIAERQAEMEKIISQRLKTTDRQKILAELSTIGEWKRLEVQAKELDAQFEKVRKEQMRLVRERITPKRPTNPKENKVSK